MRRISRGSLGLSLLLATAALIALAAGCQQHHFITEADYQHYRAQALAGGLLPAADQQTDPLDPSRAAQPLTVRNVLSPEGKKRDISLAECVALALENGRSGDLYDSPANRRLGVGPQRAGAVSNITDSIRVFSFDPAIAATEIEQSLAKFDAFLRMGATWNKVNRPIGDPLSSFQAPGTVNAVLQDTANVTTSLLKPLATGGLAGITFNTDYTLSNLNPRVNPSYQPSLQFTFEQPLLEGFGVGINQLREGHPGSIRQQFPVGGRVPGVLLTRLFTEESRLEFERRVQGLLFSVEEAYWQLYAAYWDLYSREIALRQAHAAWHTADARFKAGKISGQDFYQVEEQYQFFRGQRVQAMGRGTGRQGVLEAERRLRYLVGLPPEDGAMLVPADAPVVAPIVPDWSASLNEALARRPDLRLTRIEIQAAQLAVLREANTLLPDVRTFATYDVNAIGSRLDGTDTDNALRNLTRNEFHNWTLGIQGTMPLGFREAHAQMRRLALLAQRVAFLQDQEQRLAFAMQYSQRALVEFNELIRIQRARRLAATETLRLRYQEFLQGRGTVDVLLEAQRNWADALRDEHFAVADYNIALADYSQQKGTLLEHDNVTIAEGPLPTCVQTRASAHIRERLGSLQLCEPGSSPLLEQTGGTLIPNLTPIQQAPLSLTSVLQEAAALPCPPDSHPPAPGLGTPVAATPTPPATKPPPTDEVRPPAPPPPPPATDESRPAPPPPQP